MDTPQDNSDLTQVVGQSNDPVQDTQEASMPSAEQYVSPNESEVEDSLPEGVSERTRQQFEKVLERNKQLNEELRKRQYGESVIDSWTTPSVTQSQVNAIKQDYIDEYGNLDAEGLNNALRELNDKVATAERLALDARKREEQRQVQEAHAKFPWIDPASPQFDPQGFELVKDRLVRYLAEGSERPLSAVAQEVSRIYTPKTRVSPQVAQEKAQATSVTSGRGQPRQETPRTEDLRQATLQGDINALNERIKMATS